MTMEKTLWVYKGRRETQRDHVTLWNCSKSRHSYRGTIWICAHDSQGYNREYRRQQQWLSSTWTRSNTCFIDNALSKSLAVNLHTIDLSLQDPMIFLPSESRKPVTELFPSTPTQHFKQKWPGFKLQLSKCLFCMNLRNVLYLSNCTFSSIE